MGWLSFLRKMSASGKDGNTETQNAEDSPTMLAQKYLEEELRPLESLAGEEKVLDYHNHSLQLLAKESNNVEALGKLVSDIENDQETEPLMKSDVLKLFTELCLVLRNAAEQNEEMEKEIRKGLAEGYNGLFNRAETMKNEIEYQEAKQRGFDGDFQEYLTHLAVN